MNKINVTLDPAKPQQMLHACPAYRPSPLALHEVANQQVWIKDETNRMGLGAFKAMGGVYAVAELLMRETGLTENNLTSDTGRAAASNVTFVCASAGNHGMAVAAGARLFGAACRIHLADTVPEDFVQRLRAKGSEVVRSGATYEESIAAAIKDAEESGAVHLADGSWPGYTEPPRLVMEGYTVIAQEMRDSFASSGQWPTHVYLQAGVGGLAGAMAYMIRANWTVQPEIIVVEPDAAPCLQQSARAGEMVTVEGPVSNMGRLDCKTPSMLAYEILSKAADRYVTISDPAALRGAEISATLGIASTPSGAAGLTALVQDLEAGTSPDMRPLVILSEGGVDDA
ncbi:pyridoxal-phosphate dependent enzyme (plasmid) [Phaeobacter inhibens]|uniref:pyridoxal-phosphate dependent enzyme n=1 Tax=Phaeobacter inhibens TaxID=221822 RepID=UPI0021A2CCB2|nr:pyridoxal-phosphate dependent enzyme [Phaeobacter inhibens]UWR70692.1 pyridoxal-phosphate dependent enzyme [Phaeobacter inhibens]